VTAYEGAREAIRRHEGTCAPCSMGTKCSEGARLERAAARIYRESLTQGGLFQGPLFDGAGEESNPFPLGGNE